MKNSTKMILGAATFAPLLYVVIFLTFVFSMILFRQNPGPGGPPVIEDPHGIAVLFVLLIFAMHISTGLLSLGLSAFYVVHVVKNDRIPGEPMKALWSILFFIAGIFAQPVYWYRHIWKITDALPPPLPGHLYPPAPDSWIRSDETREREYAPPREMPDWRQ